jgi:hypothetical protein
MDRTNVSWRYWSPCCQRCCLVFKPRKELRQDAFSFIVKQYDASMKNPGSQLSSIPRIRRRRWIATTGTRYSPSARYCKSLHRIEPVAKLPTPATVGAAAITAKGAAYLGATGPPVVNDAASTSGRKRKACHLYQPGLPVEIRLDLSTVYCWLMWVRFMCKSEESLYYLHDEFFYYASLVY